jgi:hypothetical protein
VPAFSSSISPSCLSLEKGLQGFENPGVYDSGRCNQNLNKASREGSKVDARAQA